MPGIDLPERHLTRLLGLLAAHVPEAEVWAFGSRVDGSGHAGSDLDLVLRRPEALESPIGGAAALRAALEASDLPMLVDVHDWALLPPAFRTEIGRRFVVVRESGGQEGR